MAKLPEDVKVKIATSSRSCMIVWNLFTLIPISVAQDFIETYYPALNSKSGRSALASFYVKSENTKPDIIINGNAIPSPTDLQKLFETQVQKAQYDVQSYDAHILNSNYNFGDFSHQTQPDKDGKRASVIVLVSGSVKYGRENEEADVRGFTESVVLVPNLEVMGPKAMKKKARKWSIASQNFRLVA
ncbi:hypothetical protein EPUL_003040 [Erysiphe pulchra]|uniref:NTF2 domain-containing protein n=1 Tax=Erysiphe pulchra TaxID=225359 RepID=A0A2S4PTF0_9PEZI|nr:hypothetical protein EPUL_003040 [Erysiphe pulchra]